MTLLRRCGLHSLLPLDHHVSYHKAGGLTLAVLSAVHTAAHIHNLVTNLLTEPNLFVEKNSLPHNPAVDLSSLSLASWLFTPQSQLFGFIPGYALPTGLLLLLFFSILLIGALPVVRRSGFFEVFAWTHLSYLPILLLLLLHSETCWYYLLLPGLLLLLGKLLLLCLTIYRRTTTVALTCTALPSTVTRLTIQRDFDFR